MEFLPPKIEKYVEEHTTPEPALLQKLNRETHATVLMPQMLSGHVQGRFLKMLAGMINPAQVLEIGTYTGYSSLCFAEGMKEGTTVHTIDINEERAALVNRYVKQAGEESRIKTYLGNALDIIPTLNYEFDLVFIDADKRNYLNYYKLVFGKVSKGGYIIADNVLWSGKVIEQSPKKDEEARGISEFNDFVINDSRAECVMVPLRDGITIVRKLV
ncbi:MAG: O-methyltransferase [Bacteroidia bacterium]|nr:O-methyltransferase [Bacteroidia bacterium]